MSSVLRKYATATTLYFPLIGAGTVNFTSTATLTTADTKISVDGAAFATVGTAVANLGSFGYSYTCNTANLTGKQMILVCRHTAGTQDFEDTMIIVETYGHASAKHPFDLSVANQSVIASAGTVTLTGGQHVTVGTISAAAIAAGLISSGAIVSGAITASGGFPANFADLSVTATTGLVSISTASLVQAGTISAAAVTSIWNVASIEPTAPPLVTAGARSALSWLLALSLNRITQTSVLQTVFSSDTANTIATSTLADDGATFTRGSFN